MTITIRIKNNGPYIIDAEQANEVVVLDADGKRYMPDPGRPIKLCRCGDSTTKPFCDGTHRGNGFIGSCAQADGASSPEPTAS